MLLMLLLLLKLLLEKVLLFQCALVPEGGRAGRAVVVVVAKVQLDRGETALRQPCNGIEPALLLLLLQAIRSCPVAHQRPVPIQNAVVCGSGIVVLMVRECLVRCRSAVHGRRCRRHTGRSTNASPVDHLVTPGGTFHAATKRTKEGGSARGSVVFRAGRSRRSMVLLLVDGNAGRWWWWWRFVMVRVVGLWREVRGQHRMDTVMHGPVRR